MVSENHGCARLALVPVPPSPAVLALQGLRQLTFPPALDSTIPSSATQGLSPPRASQEVCQPRRMLWTGDPLPRHPQLMLF